MTRQILAFFATSFLTVAMTIPAMAEEVDGEYDVNYLDWNLSADMAIRTARAALK